MLTTNETNLLLKYGPRIIISYRKQAAWNNFKETVLSSEMMAAPPTTARNMATTSSFIRLSAASSSFASTPHTLTSGSNKVTKTPYCNWWHYWKIIYRYNDSSGVLTCIRDFTGRLSIVTRKRPIVLCSLANTQQSSAAEHGVGSSMTRRREAMLQMGFAAVATVATASPALALVGEENWKKITLLLAYIEYINVLRIIAISKLQMLLQNFESTLMTLTNTRYPSLKVKTSHPFK